MTTETRTFTSPSGRTWTAGLFAGAPGGAPVLRFRAGDVVLDLAQFPDDWLRLPDAALVALARRGEPPRFAAPAGGAAAPGPATAPAAGPAHDDATFSDRIALSFLILQMRGSRVARMERVSPGAFASLVEEKLRAAGRARPVPASEVVTWFADALPDLATVQAIADSCGVDPGWLAFGAESGAPSPTTAPGAAAVAPRPSSGVQTGRGAPEGTLGAGPARSR